MGNIFNNNDLEFDFEKIKEFDTPITVSKSFEDMFDYPFGLDVEDTSYWYANEEDRDKDFETLKSLIPKFSYING